MHPFAQYLKDNNLDALTVSIMAKVRYMTAYRATIGQPISLQNAEKIRKAACYLSGVAYKGAFAVHPAAEQPTRPMRRAAIHHS